MKQKGFTLGIIGIFTLLPWLLYAQTSRQVLDLNKDWRFHFAWDVRKDAPLQLVNLPHTWNAQEAVDGKMNYTRDAAIYEKDLSIADIPTQKRVYLQFQGVNSHAQVFVNNHFVGEHKGGYTKFCLEITNFLRRDTTNKLSVWVSNAVAFDILPLTGDFNVYGGIHRPVSLLVTSRDCISPLDYGSSGVYLSPRLSDDEKDGVVGIKTVLSLTSGSDVMIKTSLKDEGGKIISSTEEKVSSEKKEIAQSLKIKNPHLWQVAPKPYLYHITTQLWKGSQLLDEVTQPLGFRLYHVSPDSGLVLNGKYQDLYGFGFHEDLEKKGSAMSLADLKKDMAIVSESGANSLRMTHYPHSSYIYDFADSAGIVLWSEIPMVGPGGYTGTGYYKNPELENQARQVLKEMVLQNYNHPSVFFWGLFNELKLDYDDPRPFVKSLDSLCKSLDPSRPTTCATFLDGDHYNDVSDVIAWNKYYGWYGGKFSDIGAWADATHSKFPKKPIAISEYGAGASVKDHDNGDTAPNPSGKFHPEEWQTAFHIAHWKQLKDRPFVWGKYIWALSDFGSSIRTEGDRNGINDKGLVTYDRSIKKDAFYFYKANWNPNPMVYIAERRYNKRKEKAIRIRVFANVPNVTLIVNGKTIGMKSPNSEHIIDWESVALKPGKNQIAVKASKGDTIFTDSYWITKE